MPSKLRPLYDRIYTGIDTWYVGFEAGRSGRKRAAKLPKPEFLDREYRDVVLPYWKQFGVRPKKYWYRIFAQNQEHIDPRYIPDDIWFRRVVPHFNHLLFAQAYQDKCMNGLFVPELAHPAAVVKCVNGLLYDDGMRLLRKEEAVERCRNSERFIIKPSVGSGRGNGIRFLNGGELTEQDVLGLFAQYGKNFIIQEKLRQHAAISRIYPNSLNTLRIVTFLYGGEVHILSSVIRIGAGGSEIDNVSKGGFACKVHPDGRLDRLAVNRKGQWVEQHPDGTRFETVTVPNYERIIDTVKGVAARIGHFRIIGWDIAVGEHAEPVFIEYNLFPEQNQKTWGPAFGGMTDQILKEVFAKS